MHLLTEMGGGGRCSFYLEDLNMVNCEMCGVLQRRLCHTSIWDIHSFEAVNGGRVM